MTTLLPLPLAIYLGVGLTLLAIGLATPQADRLRALTPQTSVAVLMIGATLWPLCMYLAIRVRIERRRRRREVLEQVRQRWR